MLKTLLNNKLRLLIFIILVLLFACIRAFENNLFYDPFLDFFKSEFTNLPLPEFDPGKLALHLFFRYLLNTGISLALIYVAFKDIELVKFSSVLYLLFFIILIAAFFLIIYMFEEKNNLVLFYVRRFLIQPLFVILFLPAFFYQKRISKK